MKFANAFIVIFLCLACSQVNAQTINIGPGDSVANNTTFPNGSTVNVNGGTVGLGVELSNGVLNINSGNVAIGANSMATGFNNVDNIVNINGGEVGGFFQIRNGTELNLTGGVLESFGVLTNSTATITGGTVVVFPDIVSGLVNIRGGDVASVRVFNDGAVNIFGSEFELDGAPVTDLEIGETMTVTQRSIPLQAILEDGSPFGFVLNPQIVGLQPDAATVLSDVFITRVAAVGDLNADGIIDLLDIAPFVDAITKGEFVITADINRDGTVDLLDIAPFVELITD